MSKLEIVSRNVADVQYNNKRKRISHAVCNSKDDIILPQETHSTVEEVIFWKNTG